MEGWRQVVKGDVDDKNLLVVMKILVDTMVVNCVGKMVNWGKSIKKSKF